VLYAANIYPEHVHAALNNKKFLSQITGKFTMLLKPQKNLDNHLEVHVEMLPNAKLGKGLEKEVAAEVENKLKTLNMEYLFLTHHLDKDLRPRIKLWPYQHEKYFKAGLKPKYLIR